MGVKTALLKKVPLSIHLLSKSWANLACGGVECVGLPILLDALKEDPTDKGKARERGVLTVSNHISVCDDPMLWSIMPWRTFLNPRTTRWVSGAQDIMFTNPTFSQFFQAGQVLNTDRFGGIFQPRIKDCSERLTNGDWVHIFPEGKVSQHSLNPHYDQDRLFRFRWGVSQMFFNSRIPPRIIPMHIRGFDKVYPEPRPSAFLPHKTPKGTLGVAIAPSIDHLTLPLWDAWRSRVKDGFIRDDGNGEEEKRRRSEFAAVLREEVARLGREGHSYKNGRGEGQ